MALEAETDATDGDDTLRASVLLQLVAEPADGHVEGLGRAVPALAPHLCHQLGPRDHLVAVGGEHREDVELLARQRHLDVTDVDPVGLDVDMETMARADRGGARADRRTPEQGAQAGQQLGQSERLREVVVRPGVQADHPVELLARLRALLRRTATSSAGRTPTGRRLLVDVEAHRVYVGDDEVTLTGKEFDVLTVLSAHRDKVVSRAQLMADVWSEGWYGSTKTLDVTIGRLRQKLEKVACVDRVVTVRGIGFRLESS